jgi:hypothetical protein
VSSSERRTFSAAEASEVAEIVVDHDPDEPRKHLFVPEDRAAAAAGVHELALRLKGVWRSIRKALKNASDSAGYLSNDRLQGIAELIQNADDLGASHAYISVDATRSRLLFGHNGADLTLHDVWALAIPWLSLKASEAEKLGRFGIGLKTLQSLSEILEVSEGHFDVRFDPETLVPLDGPFRWPGNPSPPEGTVFAVPFAAGAVTSEDVADWLATWGEAGMVFLKSLSRITLIDESWETLAELHLEHGADEPLDLPHGRALRRTVTTSDGRQWTVYMRRAPAPEGQVRAGKAQSSVTPIALALPRFDGDLGHLHVGLPVREIGLPFRALAQFDPQANRRDIADTDWNLALVPLLADLWLDAVLDVYEHTPSLGWAAVPLGSEFADDERTTGRLREALEAHLLTYARRALAQSLSLDGGEGPLPLTDLAYEVPELSGMLSPEDVCQVSERKGAIALSARSADDRWRLVLDDLAELDTDVPYLVKVEDALALLADDERPPAFVAALVGVAVKVGETDELAGYRCLVLGDGSRVVPEERASLEILIPSESGELWGILGMGSRLHPAFAEADEWDAIRDWLHDEELLRMDASDRAALTVLSYAGEQGERLIDSLTDTQLDAIRRALEPLDDTQRHALGSGIGRAILLDGTRYDRSGARVSVQVAPAEAYLIEQDRGAWSVAAGKTPGLSWLHRRYLTDLKNARGRQGIGAQRLFRLLGAESAPRIVDHPKNHRRYVNSRPGVPRWTSGSPRRRDRILVEHHATYTVQDWSSPDLDAVLSNIAAEKDLDQRRRRALAVLGTLGRAWERLSDYATVMAANESYGWVDKGRVEAWWLSSAASLPWLTSEKGKPATPDSLSIRSNANVLLHGGDPELYLDRALDLESYREVLARIGVSGDPTVSELIEKLEEVRDETLHDPAEAQELAAPLYQALAVEVRGSRLGQLTMQTARARFGRGHGLIATNAGWRRPSVVFAGPPRFGNLRDFVPSVSGTDRLWNLLGVSEPNAVEARRVLAELARTKRTDAMVMLEALRLLAASPPSSNDKRGTLRRSPVWVGDQWMAKRPVYAIGNPLIASALKGQLPIWAPGGALKQFESLIDPYGLTRLDTPNGQVLAAESAAYDPDLSQVFSRAVGNLRTDLSASDPVAEETLAMSWETLASFRVAVLPGLRVRLVEATQRTDVTVPLDAWLDIEAETLYVTQDDAAGKPNAGGYAVAAAFGGDARRISHDWVASWSAAHDGYQAELITTAARIAAEQERERDRANEERLKALAQHGKVKRQEQKRKSKNKARKDSKPAATSAPAPMPPRLLVEPDELALHNEDGELVGGATDGGSSVGTRSTRSPSNKPKEPRPDDPRKLPTGGRARPNYTDEERERVGLDLVRRILGGDEQAVIDIRHQHNVGADAIDELRNFFELKVHSGRIPRDISLTRDEYLRARDTDDFFLVVVGNVEQGAADPEVLIITDPLGQLEMKPSGSVSLSGVRSAKALRYTFHRTNVDSSEGHT